MGGWGEHPVRPGGAADYRTFGVDPEGWTEEQILALEASFSLGDQM